MYIKPNKNIQCIGVDSNTVVKSSSVHVSPSWHIDISFIKLLDVPQRKLEDSYTPTGVAIIHIVLGPLPVPRLCNLCSKMLIYLSNVKLKKPSLEVCEKGSIWFTRISTVCVFSMMTRYKRMKLMVKRIKKSGNKL